MKLLVAGIEVEISEAEIAKLVQERIVQRPVVMASWPLIGLRAGTINASPAPAENLDFHYGSGGSPDAFLKR